MIDKIIIKNNKGKTLEISLEEALALKNELELMDKKSSTFVPYVTWEYPSTKYPWYTITTSGDVKSWE